MVLETKLHHRLSHQLVMTPQLQQAIKMLQLSKIDLIEAIQQELEENPALEEDLENKEEGVKEGGEENLDEEDWHGYLGGSGFDKSPFNSSVDRGGETTFENSTPQKTTLSEYLLWQLRVSGIDKRLVEVGEALIGNINDDGYLEMSTKEVADSCRFDRGEVEKVLRIIQDFDPAGVGARNLTECLLIQIKAIDRHDQIMEKIVSDHLPLLEKRDYKGIARALNAPVEIVSRAVKVISSLEPKPGRPFQQEPTTYITPDIYVFKVGRGYVVMPNEDGIPRLRLNDYYRKPLNLEKDAALKDYIQERARSGSWFIKSIQQRQKTVCRVVECIAKFQTEFLDKGIRYLKPLTLRDVAEEMGVHESTISRATSNKYVHTPQGVFELKYFFGSGVSSRNGEAAASESVKNTIKNIIEREDPKMPYSDESIMELLKKSGLEIARRTVTKYREAMRIPSSSKRTRKF